MSGLGRIALVMLGILAYKNREKLSDFVLGEEDSPTKTAPDRTQPPAPPKQPGVFEEVVDGVASGDGVGEVLDKFRQAGNGDAADSWVSRGPNKPLTPEQVASAIDHDTLGELADQTGLPPDELLRRIARELPEVVDKLTPEGRLPAAEEKEPTLLDEVPPRSA